ncbi:SDR family NAD(P)-dependent oxidoreductase [Gillisia sp. M10.2A]|uniref:SDR family NAD(P)-dependent oxidoreductase n=1 Tax=Gillisia lutea TaxID=2909668 RepID=A0ABS9EBV1_9FLAO|nr:SDR family NAD(P)-dependent oxidoreductase [Gillisia lutea]MCF4100322.1 SDR family NAD(P)-dependent oxidoreductase [Gillisia lutea]
MKISILGCGWLGLPLAKKLVEEYHDVKGSTTTREKMKQLSSIKITPYLLKLYEEGIQGDISSFLSDAEILIVDIPPGLRSNPEANFISKIGRLKTYIEKSGIKKVLFVSATSVYEDTADFPIYTEESAANSEAENGRQLRVTEELLKDGKGFDTTVIRFSGLLGPGRHPVNYLSGKTGISSPEAPVNLVHLEDCIGVIMKVLEKDIWGETFNVAYPDHPTKKVYYTAIAKEKNLALPDFDGQTASKGKYIESVKLKELLEFEFTTPI